MDFFDRLAADPPPSLGRMTATIRFDLDTTDGGRPTTRHWLLTIDHGEVHISHRKGRADAVISADQGLFERLVTGEANAMAATLRGQLCIEGDPQLLVAFQRILPGPPVQSKR